MDCQDRCIDTYVLGLGNNIGLMIEKLIKPLKYTNIYGL